MAPSGSIWHKESLKLKEIFGTREAFEICPNNFSPRPNFAPPGSWFTREHAPIEGALDVPPYNPPHLARMAMHSPPYTGHPLPVHDGVLIENCGALV